MKELKKEQIDSPYNSEPVYYCKSCLSLHIEIIGEPENDDSVCMHCNRTDIGQTDIYKWRSLYKEKYGCYPEEI